MVTVERQLTREQLEKVRSKLATNGVVLTGDVGTFSADTAIGEIAGSYLYTEGKLLIDVTKHRRMFGGVVRSGIERGIDEAVS